MIVRASQPSGGTPTRPGTTRPVAVGALGGTAIVTTLLWAGAPWWTVTIAVVLGFLIPGIVLLVQVLTPEESAHKRDLWLAWLRHRDRRARARLPDRTR